MTIRGYSLGAHCVSEYVTTVPGPNTGTKNEIILTHESSCTGTMHRALHCACEVAGCFRQAMVLGGKCGGQGAPGQRGGGGGGGGGPAARHAAAGGPHLREPGLPGPRPPAGGGAYAGAGPAALPRRRSPGKCTCTSLCSTLSHPLLLPISRCPGRAMPFSSV